MTRTLYGKLIGFVVVALLFAGPPLTGAHAGEVNKNAVVLLIAANKTGATIATGSGFIVTPEGVLVTNYHVLLDAAAVDAVFMNGTRVPIESILKVDRARDFAVLQLKKGFYSTLELGDSDTAKVYAYTSALGYLTQNVTGERGPVRGLILQTYGFVLGYHPQAYRDFSFLYTSTPFGPGFSGGPLVDKDNKVVGIATVEGRSINLALPINLVKPFLNASHRITFRQLLEEDKNAKEADYYRGNFSLYALGDPDAAIEHLKKALAKDPEFVLAHYDLGTALRDQGKIEQAIAQYEKTVALQPDFPEALSNLGGFYFREGKIEKAVAVFRHAIQVYPNFIQGLSNLGAALNKMGQSREAIPFLQKALSLDPEFGIAHYNLGNAYFTTGRMKECQEAFHQAVNFGIDFFSLHWKLYEINHKTGKTKEAIRQLNIILDMDPMNKNARQKLSELSSPALQ